MIPISDIEDESLITWTALIIRTKILLETLSLVELSIEQIKLTQKDLA